MNGPIKTSQPATSVGPPGRANTGGVRRDQLVTGTVGVGSAVVGIAVVAFARDTTLAVLVGLVTLCVTPGTAFGCWTRTKDRMTRALEVLAASLTWTILITTLFALLQITSLGALLAATAGVGGAGSAIFLADQIARHLSGQQDRDTMDEREDASADPQGPQGRPPPRVLLTIGLLAAAVLFAFSVVRADGRAVGSYGLLPVLGVTFLAATILTVGVIVLALRSIAAAWPAAVAAICLLLVEFNGTQVMFDSTPISSWTYKHFGVVDYIVHGGALNNTLDIYQQWPGFFAATAGLVRLSGRSELSFANWAQLFFEALNALVLFAIARRLAAKHPVVPYVTVLLYITANWEGQIYFAPQTIGFLLALLVQFFLLPFIEPERLRRLFRDRSWLVIPPLDISGESQITSVGALTRVIGILALFTAIVVTHQLSPYMIFAGTTALWLLGVLRHRAILITMVIVLLGYYLLHLPAALQNEVLNGLSFSNLTGQQGATPSSAQQQFASEIAEILALGLWGGAFVCVLSYRRRFGDVAIPAVLAAAPAMCVLVSGYDGEGIYRVFLFSSPWCALIIAKRLAELRRLPMLRWSVAGCWAIFAAMGSAQSQDFGMYQMVFVQPSEISADAYFLDHAPTGSVLVLAAANFPSRLNWKYVLHNPSNSQNDLSLDEDPTFAKKGLNNISASEIAHFVRGVGGCVGYLAIGPSMEQYSDYYGTFAPGTMPSLVLRLKVSPYWKLWYENDGTVIFETVVLERQELR
jgi:hypothetical protein